MLQREFRVHVLEPSVFFFQLTQAANVGGFHATILCLPLVIGGVADFVFATNVSDGLARLDGFQNGDDLRLAEFALSHSGLLASYSPGNLYFSMARFLGRVTAAFPLGPIDCYTMAGSFDSGARLSAA